MQNRNLLVRMYNHFLITVMNHKTLQHLSYVLEDKKFNSSPVMSDEFYCMTSMTHFDAIHTNSVSVCSIACLATIEIMHWERCVAGYFVQALAISYSFLNSILITEYPIFCLKYKMKLMK